MLTAEQITTIRRRIEAIEPMLGGLGPVLQGAILADLTATWLAGHQGEGAERFREELLQMHVEQVRKLIPINERAITQRQMIEQIEDGKLQ